MTFALTHLANRAITEVGLGDRDATARERTHLAACTDCRARVQQLRSVRDTMRAAPGPTAGEDLFSRIEARVNAGERVILPTETLRPEQARDGRRLLQLATACVVVAAGVVLFRSSSSELIAGGTSGELHFSPNAPRMHDSVRVDYEAPQYFAKEDSLVLRARFRTAAGQPYQHSARQQVAAILHRNADGRFHAAFQLPDSVVYATFAVENPAASRVDSHAHHLWSVLVSNVDGRPRPDALDQRVNDLMGGEFAGAFASVQAIVGLYPDRPHAWTSLRSFEQLNFGSRADANLPAHRARVVQLHELLKARHDSSFSTAHDMMFYAGEIFGRDDSLGRTIRDYWRPVRQRAIARDTTDPAVIADNWWRINARALAGHGKDSARAALRDAERYWDGLGRYSPVAPLVGFQVARENRDAADALLRWTDRYAETLYEDRAYLYVGLSYVPSLRREAVARLSALRDTLLKPDDHRRPLELTRAEAAAEDSSKALRTMGLLANAMLANGDTTSARQVLEQATATGWNVALLRTAASTQLALGDTANALVTLARVVADPLTSDVAADSIRGIAQHSVNVARWRALVTDARATMRERLLTRAVRLRLTNEANLLTADSVKITLPQLTTGRVAVVTFWSTCCGALSYEQLHALDNLSARLAAMNAVLVPVARESPSVDAIAFARKQGAHVPLYFDHDHTAQTGFGQWSIPDYYVLDAGGRVRFQHSSLDLVLAQAAALSSPDR